MESSKHTRHGSACHQNSLQTPVCKSNGGHCRTVRSLLYTMLAIGTVILILTGTACKRSGDGQSKEWGPQDSALVNDSKELGNPEATSRYWDAVNKITANGTGIEALTESAIKGVETDAELAAIYLDVAQVERERSRAISALPLLGVDSKLATQNVEMVQLRQELAQTLSQLAGSLDKRADVLDPGNLVVGAIVEAIKQRDDPKADILSVGASEFKQTQTKLEQLAPDIERLTQTMISEQESLSKLSGAEIGLRLHLTQTYGREFKPLEDYIAEAKKQQAHLLDKNFVLESLDGQSVGGWFTGFPGWDFNKGTQTFTSFEILRVTNQPDGVIDYYIQTHVKGIINEDDIKLHLTYRPMITRLKLVAVARN